MTDRPEAEAADEADKVPTDTEAARPLSQGTDAPMGVRAVGWRRAAMEAIGTGLGEPRLWPLALVSFLLRGGVVLYLLPIVVVPSTVGIATFIGPTAITPAGPSERFVWIVVIAVLVLLSWIVVGGLVSAAAEASLVRLSLRAGAGPGGTLAPIDLGLAARLLGVRLVAACPLVLALAWGLPRVVAAGYRELTLPSDTATPLPFRVLSDVPEVLVAVLLFWALQEVVAGLAARRIVLLGERGPRALGLAVHHVVRRPLATLATVGLTLGGSAVLIAPGLVAAGLAWDRLRGALVGDAETMIVFGFAVLFVAVWGSSLALAGAAGAWRSVAWTLEVLRVLEAPPRR